MDLGKKIAQVLEDKKVTKKSFSSKMGISRQTLDNWINGDTFPTSEDLQKMSKILDVDLSKITLRTESKYVASYDHQSIPFYDVVAVGGATMLAEQNAVYEPTTMIDPGTFLRAATGSLRIYGHSMFPKYPAGCIVAFKNADKDVIIWGEDYVIELEDRRIIKRLERSEMTGIVKAVSYNKSEDYVYAPIDIPIGKIKRLFMVLGKIELEASI